MDLFTTSPLPEPHQVSEPLATALRAGDLPAAMKLVSGRSPSEAAELMLKAGFSVGGYGHTAESRRWYWRHFEMQLAKAAHLCVDGWGLRERAGQ